MLIEFSVENFRSIKEKQTLSMLSSGKVSEHPENLMITKNNFRLNKSSIIYGRNASGKTNLLMAMKALEFLVRRSVHFKLDQEIPPYEPFKLDKISCDKPTNFEIDFIAIDNVRYKYSLSYSKSEIIDESLFYYPKGQPAKLFVREQTKPILFGTSIKGDRRSIEKQLLNNQLFLSKGANSNIEQLKAPYLFFNKYIFARIFSDFDFDDSLINSYTRAIAEKKDTKLKENLDKLIRIADTGISSIMVNEVSIDKIKFPDGLSEDAKKRILDRNKYEIKTIHKIYDEGITSGEITFDLHEESMGTIKLLAVGGMILDALSDGTVLIIDELDKSLHPLLTRILIKLFHNPKTNPKNAQLIFATHDVSLLDKELFRRDQIWFTEKETAGATKLYSLSDIKGIRKEFSYEKWYLSGRFGGTPVINELELISSL